MGSEQTLEGTLGLTEKRIDMRIENEENRRIFSLYIPPIRTMIKEVFIYR